MADETKIARLAEIKEQVKALGEEAQRIAEEEQVTVYFDDTPFARAYGAGNLRYTPEGIQEQDNWSYYTHGWLSSGSDEC